MDPKFLKNRKLEAPDVLRLEHDHIRDRLTAMTRTPRGVGEAARRVARLYWPHFEREEAIVFPLFALLHELALGDVQPEMAAALTLISRFSAEHEHLHRQQQSIVSAIGALLAASRREQNEECVSFAYQLWQHERREDVVLFPTIILMANYIRDALEVRRNRDRNYTKPYRIRSAAGRVPDSLK